MINLEPSLLCLRGDVTSNWITFNPILTLNEPAIEIFNDGNVKMKIGNGVDNFLDLPYLNEADNVNPDWNSTGGLSEILNKPTTVSGYGLSDVYTINEVDFKILTIQEASNSTNGFMSINDFIKLSGISSGATKNDTDQNLKNRQNHTGTQLSNTISDFVKSVNDSQLSEIYIDNTDVTSGDTVCSSINKLQSQNSNIKSNLSSHVNNVNNPHGVTKYQIDLGSVDNTSDMNKPISISTQNALNLKVDKTTSIVAGSGLTGGGVLSGNTTINVVSLNDGILVNNDNIELKTINDLTTVSTTKPLSANQGKILNDKYSQLETENSNIKSNLSSHVNNVNNPHGVTKFQIDLGYVDNTSDMNKPISISTQNALNLKVDKTTSIVAGSGLTGGGDLSSSKTINVVSANDAITVNPDNIQLNTIDNLTTISTTKPLSANQGKILNDKATQIETENSNIKSNLSSHVNNVNNPHGVTKYQIDLGSVDNTSDVNKPISISTQNALNLKVDKTTTITAGLGLTGGGALDTNKTIDVGATDDSIIVGENGIKVDTINDLTTVSTTKPLSANQGKILNDKYSQLETDLNYMYPSVGTAKRILTYDGTIKSRSTLNDLTNKFLDLLPNTKLLFCPHLAVKLRESGIYKYVTKLYDIGPGMLDGAQTTALNQPYLSGNIAPNEKYAIKNPNGGNAYLTHTSISFSATDKWSVTFSYNNNWHDGTFAKIISSQGDSHIRFQSSFLLLFNSISEYTSFSGMHKIIGKNSIYTLVARGNGKIDLYVNGILNATNTFNTEMSFSKIFESAVSSYGTMTYYCIRNIALTPTQVKEEYNYLRTLFPEIESVQIGTQTWATSNCEMTCTPQGNVIPEMQAAMNVEKISNGISLTDSDNNGLADGFSTLNNPITSIVTGNGFPGRAQRVEYMSGGGTLQSLTFRNVLFPNKLYRLSFKYRANKEYAITDTNAGISSGAVPVNIGDAIEKTIYFKHSGPFTILAFNSWLQKSGDWFEIGDITLQEVGWTDSTNLYNYIYANTTGTAEQKEYAAVKAAAMWCHYNNDSALGAIYGKLYNWYAVKLLQMDIDYYNAANPTATWGWRVPTNSDFTALSTYLGGDAVAGGKLKKDGLDYWGTPNTGADNSSGFSAIPNGYRHSRGSFYSQNTASILRFINKITGECIQIGSNTSSFSIISGFGDSAGMSLRLIKA